MSKSLFEKVWDAHAVRQLANGQLLVGTGITEIGLLRYPINNLSEEYRRLTITKVALHR